MIITLEELAKLNACPGGIKWFCDKYAHKSITFETLISDLLQAGKEIWINWLVTGKLSADNCVKYAIFAAEQVLHLYEDKYPGDKRPRNAIDAAKKYLKDKNDDAARAAYDAARAAYDAAYDVHDAFYSHNAFAARAAYDAAYAAFYAARDATYAAEVASYAAARDVYAYAAHAGDAAAHAANSAAAKKEWTKKI
jgi:hypothetical protein